MPITVNGPQLSVQTCRRRLAAVGAPDDLPAVDCTISWFGPAGASFPHRGSEATVQAISGMMAVHGWDSGYPRRLGLEMASVAAGILAANGVLAALIADQRGLEVPQVQTSVLQAGLLLVAHHMAAATAEGEPLLSPPGPDPGPPFRTVDNRWFEIEVFDPEGWKAFWGRLGASGADLGRAWTAFRARYYRGRCSLPAGLHQATGRRSLAEAIEAARASKVSLCPVRSYSEVLENPGWAQRHPNAVGDVVEAPMHRSASSGGVGEASLPLKGVRVVEATSRMQGPLAGLLLQMLGAEVIRVEPPGGDIGRMVPPSCGEVGSFFQCYNRGKKSVELDLRNPSGRDDLLGLLADSDAFVHNWAPGRAATWKLEQPDVARANPRIVFAAASGWGECRDNEHLIGTDFLVQAFAGFGDGLNPVGDAPLTSRALLTDCMGALVTCEGVLAGLYLSLRSGRGVEVGTSLLDGAMASQVHVLEALASGGDRHRPGGRPVWGPLDRPIATQDGYLVLSADDSADYARVCHVCQVDLRGGRNPAVDQRLVQRLAAGRALRWEKLLADSDVPAAVVTTDLAQLACDERLRPVLEELSPTCVAPGTPWVLDR